MPTIGEAKKRGGRRPGAGRKHGSQTRATRELKRTLSEIARDHTETAIATLVSVCSASESDSARVAAANALLDRGYGKATQAHHHSGSVGTYDLTRLSDDDLERLESILGPLADAGTDTSGEG